MPDFRADNPYQSLLARGVEQNSPWSVDFYPHYRRGLPFYRAVSTQKKRPDCFHLHWLNPFQRGRNFFSTLLYNEKIVTDLALIKQSGIPLVWTFHNRLGHDTRHPGLESRLFRRVARISNRMIVHHQCVRAEVSQALRVSEDKLEVIPHGHYRDFYGPPLDKIHARRELNLPRDANVCLFFGMLRPYKGLEALLDAWPAITAKTPQAMLLVAGNTNDPVYKKQLLEMANGVDGVKLDIRFIPDEAVPKLFSAADIAVFPFKKILTSGSVILSLSYDCPVVAPDFPTIRETVNPINDGLYPVGDSAAMGERVIHLLHNPPVRPQDWQIVRKRLDWDQIGRQTADLYQAVSQKK